MEAEQSFVLSAVAHSDVQIIHRLFEHVTSARPFKDLFSVLTEDEYLCLDLSSAH